MKTSTDTVSSPAQTVLPDTNADRQSNHAQASLSEMLKLRLDQAALASVKIDKCWDTLCKDLADLSKLYNIWVEEESFTLQVGVSVFSPRMGWTRLRNRIKLQRRRDGIVLEGHDQKLTDIQAIRYYVAMQLEVLLLQ